MGLSPSARDPAPRYAMPRPCAVVFDMDGLMFNTEDVYYRVGTELLRCRGCQYTRDLSDAMMGRPPQACFERMIEWHALSDDWQSLARESEEIFVGLLDGYLAPMPGLLDLLDALESAGVPKAICTSSSRRLLDEILSRFAMQNRFRFTLTAEDITRGKPDPEIYLAAAGRFGIRPDEMLVLEDSQTVHARRLQPGPWWLPCPANTVRARISVPPRWSSRAWRIGGFMRQIFAHDSRIERR